MTLGASLTFEGMVEVDYTYLMTEMFQAFGAQVPGPIHTTSPW